VLLHGDTTSFLQMSVERDRAQRLIVLRQQRHIESLSEAAGLSDSWPIRIPVITGIYKDPLGAAIIHPAVISQYRSSLRALMHLANYSRPVIAFATAMAPNFLNMLDRFVFVLQSIMHAPCMATLLVLFGCPFGCFLQPSGTVPRPCCNGGKMHL
jgi:hypothetical protein